MEFEQIYEEYFEELLGILLKERLEYNNSFNRVEVEHNSNELTITWGNDKERIEKGYSNFSKRGIPFSFSSVHDEVSRQYIKLRNKR